MRLKLVSRYSGGENEHYKCPNEAITTETLRPTMSLFDKSGLGFALKADSADGKRSEKSGMASCLSDIPLPSEVILGMLARETSATLVSDIHSIRDFFRLVLHRNSDDVVELPFARLPPRRPRRFQM
jgi:hypothetical protein